MPCDQIFIFWWDYIEFGSITGNDIIDIFFYIMDRVTFEVWIGLIVNSRKYETLDRVLMVSNISRVEIGIIDRKGMSIDG